MSGVFITSTGTEIGKTLITAALARQLKDRGEQVFAIKPILSGYDPNTHENDTDILIDAMGLEINEQTINAVTPWRYEEPLSPDMAAELAGEGEPDWHAIQQFCKEQCDAHAITLVEGAGGVMSPLLKGKTNLDLIKVLDIPVLLVAGGYLGSISHTLSAVQSLRSQKVSIQAIILNATGDLPVPIERTKQSIEECLPDAPPIIMIPWIEQAKPWQHLPDLTWIMKKQKAA